MFCPECAARDYSRVINQENFLKHIYAVHYWPATWDIFLLDRDSIATDVFNARLLMNLTGPTLIKDLSV